MLPVASIEATAAFEELQTPPVVALLNAVDAPSHTVLAPVMAATTGSGVTTTAVGAVVVVQPLAPVTV